MNIFAIVLNSIGTLAALATVYLAARALGQGAEAARTGRETVQLAKFEREQRERAHRRDELERIGRLVEDIFWAAKSGPDTGHWRCPQQNELARALIGVDAELRHCKEVVEAATAPGAYGNASEARREVQQAIESVARIADERGPAAIPDKDVGTR